MNMPAEAATAFPPKC